MIARLAAVALLAAAAGCTSFEYTRCGDQVCAADLACCGTACVPATCGDGEVQPAEQCDTWTLRACTDTGFDFGQRGCTATCALDDTPCVRFGFHAGGLPCDVPKPSQLGVAGDTLWVGTRLKLAVAVGAGGCRTATLATAPSRLLAVSADEAIAVLNPAALQVVSPAGVVDLPFTLPGVQSSVVVDERTVVLGHSGGALTVIERGATGWAARAVTLGCPATGLRRIDAVARLGDQLVVVFFATVPQLGTVPLTALAAPATAATATCRDLLGVPPATDWNAAHAGADGLYVVGNATAADLTVTSVVVRVRAEPDGSLASTILRGAQPVDLPSAHLAPLAPIVRSWLDPAGALHVAGGADALVLRDDRWRRLDEPIDRDFGATVAYRDVAVTTTLSSALTSRGHGYEVIDDLAAVAHPARCAATATSCTIGAAGRARGAGWMLVTAVDTTTTRTIVRDGVRIARDLAGAAWLPLALGFGGDTEWIVARPTGRLELYLWRSADDPAPTRIAASCTVAVLDLDVGPTMAAAATRLGRVDDVACPRTHEVVRRRTADDVVETLWRSPDEIRQLAVPADGADVVLALVTTRDDGGVVTALRIVEVRPDGTAHERATLDGDRDVRGMWADDRDHAWLVGDRGLLLRFTGSALIDRSSDLGRIAGATLRAVAGTGRDDVFLAGDDNALFHFDGHLWTPVSPSSQIESFTTLALGPDDVWLGAGDRALSLRVPRAPPVAPSCPAP